jgi:hypothetical protein
MSDIFKLRRHLFAALICVFAAPVAKADPVDVSYAVSGSAGAWLLDFSVTNNLGGTNDVYFFGIKAAEKAAAQNVVSPPDWDPSIWPTFRPSDWSPGGSATVYNNNWSLDIFAALSDPGYAAVYDVSKIAPGETLSGFKLQLAELPTSVAWFAYAYGGKYDGPSCFNCGSNPGFEGTAFQSAVVPLPASLPLLTTSLGAIAWLSRRKRRASAGLPEAT